MKKTKQLQIRVTPREKQHIERAAEQAGMEVSKWVLGKLLPEPETQFQALCKQLGDSNQPSYALAQLNDFLTRLSTSELKIAVAVAPQRKLDGYLSNYLAAMIEQAMVMRKLQSPGWTKQILPLREPAFASELINLRLYLLTHALPSFRRRNIFIDSSIGARV